MFHKNHALRHTYILLLGILGFLSLTSCESFNEPEPIPSYLKVDSLQVVTGTGEGSGKHGLLDAWVFVGDNLLGIYEVPFEVPILKESNTEIKILGGIKLNGQNEIRRDYPFYDFYTEVVDFQPNTTSTISPILRYNEGLNFWIEDFEDPGVKFIKSAGSDTALERTIDTNLVYDQTGTGVIHLDQERNHAIVVTDNDFVLPAGVPVFLEMDYNTDVPLALGVFSEGLSSVTKINILTLVSTQGIYEGGWNKVYLDLSTVVSAQPGTPLEIFIEAIVPSSKESTSIYLDNIKLVYP